MAAINYLQAAKYPLRSQIQDNFRQIAALKANLLLIKITMNISYVNITMQSKLFWKQYFSNRYLVEGEVH